MSEQPGMMLNLKTQDTRQFGWRAWFPSKGGNGLFIFCSVILVILYTVISLILPHSEKIVHGVVTLLLLAASSYIDIRENHISVIIICGISVASIIHNVFFTQDSSVWVIAAAFSAFLLVIHLVKRDAVGVGDIMLLGLSISGLAVENILSFLFVSFLLSSAYGIVLIALKKNHKAGVPMAPCITLAWLTVFLLLT